MSIRTNIARRNSVADARVSSLTVLEIRTGSQPATADTTASGTLLATITGITWGAASSGAAAVSGTPNVAAVASGTAGWGRFRNAGDTARMDGVVGTDFTLADPNVVIGGTVTLTSATLTEPAG